MIIVPPPLRVGDTIGIVSPASPEREAGRVARGIDYLRKRGYRVIPGKGVGARLGYLAGSDDVRAADMNAMIADRKIRAIMCTRGGYGSTRILPMLDYERLTRHPKIFVGFSDTTAISLAILAQCNIVTFNGALPGVDLWHEKLELLTEETWREMMTRRPISLRLQAHRVLGKGGEVRGRLVGGTLTIVASLIGTPYLPKLRNAVWVFEDVAEQPYRIDRMLQQCSNAGLFERAAGVVFGAFSQCEREHEGTQTVEDVIKDFARRHPIPVFTGLPFGHVRRKLTLPIGARVTVADAR